MQRIIILILIFVSIFFGVWVGQSDMKRKYQVELDGMALRIDAAENELMNIRASCDALLYGE